MYPTITNVTALNNYRLELHFNNDEIKVLDMSPYISKGIYKALKDTNLFKTARVSFDSIEWANNADLDPEFLYVESKPIQ